MPRHHQIREIQHHKKIKKIHRRHSKINESPKKRKSKKIFFFIILLASAAYIFLFREELRPFASQTLLRFETFLSNYEILFSGYSHLKEHIFSVSYLGVAYVMFFLSLFFLPAPIEVIFIGYLLTGLNPWIVALISAVANTLGHIVNFLLGVLFGRHFLKKSKSKIISILDWLKNHGNVFLFVFNFLPLPAQFISVAYGFVKSNLKRFVILTFIARLLKFGAIIFLFSYSRPILMTFFGI